MNFWYIENNCDSKQINKDKNEKIFFLSCPISHFYWFFNEFLVHFDIFDILKENILRFFSQNIDILWHLINESGTLDIIHENIWKKSFQ